MLFGKELIDYVLLHEGAKIVRAPIKRKTGWKGDEKEGEDYR